MEERSISRLKYDGVRVEIATKSTWGVGNEREVTMRSVEEPDPALQKALDALPPLIRNLLELPDHWAEGKLSVVSISWSWSASTEVRGASICCRADLECATAPLIFNTPHLPYEQYSERGQQPVMPDDLVDALDEVERQAERYLAGARAQEDLFAPRDGKAAAAGELVEA